jgi:hypothetical protein
LIDQIADEFDSFFGNWFIQTLSHFIILKSEQNDHFPD